MSKSSVKRAFWQSNIDNYQNSGLTLENWCQNNNITISSIRYWITKFNKEALIQADENIPVFARVETTRVPNFSLNGSAPVIIRLGSLEISISDNCHPELLENLVGILSAYA